MITIKPVLHFNGHTPVRAELHVQDDKGDSEGMTLNVSARSTSNLKAQAHQLGRFLDNESCHLVKICNVEKDYDSPFNDTHDFS